MAKLEHETLPKGVLPDPATLVKHQVSRDKAHTAWKPSLLDRKNARMRVAPFAFLRGTAPMYYELLATCPWLADGPSGEGWLVGDMHLENFGAIRSASSDGDAPEIVFSLNDFDDAVIGPWYLDVLRLTTSALLAARAAKADGATAIHFASTLLESYRKTMANGHVPKAPKMVTALVEQVKTRGRAEWLAQRTHVVSKKRRFVLGERYEELPHGIGDPQDAVNTFTPADGSPRPVADHLELVDAAFRIAGTGSLGCRRVAALVSGKGGLDGCWVFDIKEEGEPSASILLGSNDLEPHQRVVSGARACLGRMPLMMGTTKLGGRQMLIRRLMPQEDKIDAGTLNAHEFQDLVEYLGALAALAHTRGATNAPKHHWSAEDAEHVLANAVVMAGWHEGAYLAYSRTLVARE